jgi:cbb3-type cytochrome oxidase maturation protein
MVDHRRGHGDDESSPDLARCSRESTRRGAEVSILFILIPVSLCLGLVGLAAFFWSLQSGQFEDLDGDGQRILFDEDAPLPSSDISAKETTR